MVLLCQWEGKSVTISVKPNCLTVSFEAAGQVEVFSYDYAGRLWTALLDGVSYRRGLDGKMVAKWMAEDGSRDRRWLAGEQAIQIESRARAEVIDLYKAISGGNVVLSAPLPDQGRLGFERVAEFDALRSVEDASRYFQVYQPVGILPPDQYMAVVLQATEGCAFNKCTFCSLYKDRVFRVKTTDEFWDHAQNVRNYLGDGMSLRRTIFLGDANALVVPQPRLRDLLDVVHGVYDVEGLGGIYAFLDGFSGERKSVLDYRQLADRGLKRVYIGMESGNDQLLGFLHKPGKAENVLQAVRVMKGGGVAVGVIVLLGAGGKSYAQVHVRDTIQVLNQMDLDMDDLLYFSELVVDEGMQYARDAFQRNIVPLSSDERISQQDEIERGLKFRRENGIPHISRYDIREFVY